MLSREDRLGQAFRTEEFLLSFPCSAGARSEPCQFTFGGDEIFRRTTPCRGTSTEKSLYATPNDFCLHRSRITCGPARPKSAHFAATTNGTSERLNNPTAFEPSSKSLAQTSVSSSVFETRLA